MGEFLNPVPPPFSSPHLQDFCSRQGQEQFPAFLAFQDDPFSAQKVDNSACYKLKLNKTPQELGLACEIWGWFYHF